MFFRLFPTFFQFFASFSSLFIGGASIFCYCFQRSLAAKPKSCIQNMTFLPQQFSREIGGQKCRQNCILQTRQMLKSLVISQSRNFLKLPTILSNGQVFYDDGKLLLAHKGTNSVDCYNLREGGRGNKNLSSALCRSYSIPLKPTIKDQVTFFSRFL